MAIATGTRGTWLAMGVVALIASVTGAPARRWVKVQLLGAAAGLALTGLLICALPQWLNITITNDPEQRLNLGLSAREVIWGQAWEMIQSAP